MNKNQSLILSIVVVAGIMIAAGLWLNRGYGQVSPETYQYSKALYSACLSQNEVHLSKVEDMLSNSDDVPANERTWLETIITQARVGEWQSAAGKARQMMEDQVEY